MAHLLPFRRHGEIVGWVTVLGVGPDGKRRKRFFKDKTRAESFLNEHVRLSVDPLHGRRHEVMFSLERLDHVGISLNEVVEFYLRHGSQKRNPPLHESVTLFLDQKRLIGRGTMTLSFSGGLDFGRVGQPQRTADSVLNVASLGDLMAMKVKVILQRSEAKDYQDIAAMVRANVRLDLGLAAAEKMFHLAFAPSESLKALAYFKGGDVHRLSPADRAVLVQASRQVCLLPEVPLREGLAPSENLAREERRPDAYCLASDGTDWDRKRRCVDSR